VAVGTKKPSCDYASCSKPIKFAAGGGIRASLGSLILFLKIQNSLCLSTVAFGTDVRSMELSRATIGIFGKGSSHKTKFEIGPRIDHCVYAAGECFGFGSTNSPGGTSAHFFGAFERRLREPLA
jgi:hypothetical protein